MIESLGKWASIAAAPPGPGPPRPALRADGALWWTRARPARLQKLGALGLLDKAVEIGPGADHVAWDHWLYPHAHHEQGTNGVSEHVPYEKNYAES